MDFKEPVTSTCGNYYLVIIVDEISLFLFAFPCKNMTSSVVTQCLDMLFAMCDTANFVHSDNVL